jgi:hypothetical protein
MARAWINQAMKLFKLTAALAATAALHSAIAAYMLGLHALQMAIIYYGAPFERVESLCFVPISNPITCVADAAHRFELRFGSMFHFRSPGMIATVICALGLATSDNVLDPGIRLVCSKGSGNVFYGAQLLLLYVFRLVGDYASLDSVGELFGMEATRASRAFSTVSYFLYTKFRHLFTWDYSLSRLSESTLERFSTAVEQKYIAEATHYGCHDGILPVPIRRVFAFMDGTFIASKRPSNNTQNLAIDRQALQYNGDKCKHGAQYIASTLPNGILFGLCGPFPGKENDLFMVRHSGVHLAMDSLQVTSRGYRMLGDGLFQNVMGITRVPTLADIKSNIATSRQSKAIASTRSAIEHGFGAIKRAYRYFTTDKFTTAFFHGREFINAALLINCRTCLEGAQQGVFFDQVPPSLSVYLSGAQL